MSLLVNHQPLVDLIAKHGEEKIATVAGKALNAAAKRTKYANKEEEKEARRKRQADKAELRRAVEMQIKAGKLDPKQLLEELRAAEAPTPPQAPTQ